MKHVIRISYQNKISLEQIASFACHAEVELILDPDPHFRQSIALNHQFMLESVASGWPIYGATTGFGSSSTSRLGSHEVAELQKNLYRYHGCGVGPYLSPSESAAVLIVRLNCLTYACSGISFDLLDHLQGLARARMFPMIRSQGSVGASGDLTPLSYLAAVVAGERQVWWRGEVREAQDVYEHLGMRPYTFKAREALALMNGTSVMAALSGLAWLRVQQLVRWAQVSTALMVELWQGPAAPFLAALHHVKPHAGQQKVAAAIQELLHEAPERLLRRDAKDARYEGSVQDPYSLRCVPQLLGAVQDVLDTTRIWIETEINSVNDNPVFLHEEKQVLNGGHFFGGHIAAACDALKAGCANALNLLDRQMALLLESRGRLPENLVSSQQDAPYLHHGFKAMQITISALAAEATKLAAPMSVLSRPTEASNQDVVSMGTIAARDLLSLSRLAMDGVAIQCMALCQAFYILEEKGERPPLNQGLEEILDQWKQVFPMQIKDRALDADIQAMVSHLFGELAWS